MSTYRDRCRLCSSVLNTRTGYALEPSDCPACGPGAAAGEVDECAQLRAEVLALKQERDGANRRGFDSGRAVGREDVGKYARAIGEIEGLVGITGAVPLRDTVAAVRALQQSLTSARESERRLRERVTQALDDLAEADAWLHPGEPKDAVARARKALTDAPPCNT